MTREEAKEFMWKENNKNPSVIQWQHHKTIRDLHDSLVAKIYSDFKLELEAEFKRGQDSILSRSCESCKFVDDRNDGIFGCFKLMCKVEKNFSCNEWEQK